MAASSTQRGGQKYGLLTYSTSNLGDEIQSIAAAQFLPAIDLRIDRDQLDRLPDGAADRYKIILNGWHNHAPERWPPDPSLDPLLTSIHITQEVFPSGNLSGLKPSDILVRGGNLDYLRGHGPVGARDTWTRDLLLSHGVDSFFSGCLTLTLGTGEPVERGDYICAVDLPPPLLRHLLQKIRSRLLVRTHHHPAKAAFGERAYLARRQLSVYARAKCVVTTRLHCALPSLAMGTPVLFINTAKDVYRFQGLTEFLHAYSAEEFLDPDFNYDPDSPPPNSDAHKPYRAALIEVANRFVGSGTAPADRALDPFVPDAMTDELLDEQLPASAAQPAAAAFDTAFRNTFPPGRGYGRDSRPDFLRDIAWIHEKGGDLEEARRLLRIAAEERPAGGLIRERLNALEKPRAVAPLENGVAPGGGGGRTRSIVSAVRNQRHTYLSADRLESLIEQATRVKARSVPGNFVECGIGLGGSGICVASQLDGVRQYWGFDVFGMIPPPSDADGKRAKQRYEAIASGQSSGIGSDTYYGYVPDLYRKVVASFAEFGLRVDGATINLVSGLFETSLPTHVNFPIALAHIDCDWYEHVKYCLNFIRDAVSKYGVIVVDDYSDWPGCRKAVDEFLSENDNMILEIMHTHAIILKT